MNYTNLRESLFIDKKESMLLIIALFDENILTAQFSKTINGIPSL